MEKEIIFVTGNKGKVESANRRFNGRVRFVAAEFDYDELRSQDVIEVVKKKILDAYKVFKQPCIALDAAFCIPSLRGFPGTFVNFCLDTIGVEGILKLTKNEDRECYFLQALAFHDGEKVRIFQCKVSGKIAREKRGELSNLDWSELSKIFVPSGESKTLAEMSATERTQYENSQPSAFEMFAEWYIMEQEV